MRIATVLLCSIHNYADGPGFDVGQLLTGSPYSFSKATAIHNPQSVILHSPFSPSIRLPPFPKQPAAAVLSLTPSIPIGLVV